MAALINNLGIRSVRLTPKPLYYVGKVHGIHMMGDGVGFRDGLEYVENIGSAALMGIEL
jgi:hypothetical protein